MKNQINPGMPIDLYSDEVRQNPYPSYAEIRRAGAAVYDHKKSMWYVGRYNDVFEVLRNAESFSNQKSGVESTLHGADGVLHKKARKIVQPAFSPEHIKMLQQAIQDLAVDTADRIAQLGHCEFVSQVAGVIPGRVFAWMLGNADDKVRDFRRWSDGIVMAGGERLHKKSKSKWRRWISAFLPRKSPPPKAGKADLQECEAFLKKHFCRAGVEPTGGWITDLIAGNREHNGLLDHELIDIGLLFVVAANETTTSLIASAAYILARDSSLQEQLRHDPGLIEPFIEEVLRYEAPAQRRPRFAVQDTQIGDVSIPAGSRIMALIGAANRDPEKFPEPDQFRLDRQPNRHLSFGAGPHFCIGSELARMEARAMLGALLQRAPFFRLANPEERIEHPAVLNIRGPRRLHLRFA
jgi:cytochrome P450